MPSTLSRSALTRATSPWRSREKLRAGTAASNKRRRAIIVFMAVMIGVAITWMTSVILDATKQYEAECAVVAQINRTHDVVVCVRGIRERYRQQRIPGSGFEA